MYVGKLLVGRTCFMSFVVDTLYIFESVTSKISCVVNYGTRV